MLRYRNTLIIAFDRKKTLFLLRRFKNLKFNKTVTLLLVGCLCAGFFGYVFASYLIESNHITGTVGQQAGLALTLNGSNQNGTQLAEGSQNQLTALLSDSSSGITVYFYDGAASVGSAVTDSNGNATMIYTIPVGATTYDLYAKATHP